MFVQSPCNYGDDDAFMQMETAALKKVSDTRSRVFVRKVVAVYTPATLEAGSAEDVGIEAAAAGTDDAEAGPIAVASSASACLMCVCEDGAADGTDRGVLTLHE